MKFIALGLLAVGATCTFGPKQAIHKVIPDQTIQGPLIVTQGAGGIPVQTLPAIIPDRQIITGVDVGLIQGPGTKDFVRGPRDFVRGPRDFDDLDSGRFDDDRDFGRGRRDFVRGPRDFDDLDSGRFDDDRDFGRGRRDFVRGPRDFDVDSDSGRFGDRDFARGPRGFARDFDDLDSGRFDDDRDFGRGRRFIKDGDYDDDYGYGYGRGYGRGLGRGYGRDEDLLSRRDDFTGVGVGLTRHRGRDRILDHPEDCGCGYCK